MARYVTTVRSSMSAADAFAYMADVRNFAEWDPGTIAAVQVAGDGPGPDAAYELEVSTGPTSTTMRYEVVAYEEPHHVRLVARTSLLRSEDDVRIERDGRGCLVTYDATLTLAGPLRLADPLLSLAFRRIGDRAAAGLAEALRGEVAAA